MEIAQAINEVIAAGKELVERGLVSRTWGNVSCRVDENIFVITPSGIGYERLTPDDIVQVDIQTLEYQGVVKPSSEKGIHAAAYRLDPGTNFLIHTHQTYATCVSVAGFSDLRLTHEEREILDGDVGIAKYAMPGTKKLRGHVEEMLSQGHTAILMEKHGALLIGSCREQAFLRSVALEDACRRAVEGPGMSDGAPQATSKRTGDGFEFTDIGGTHAVTKGKKLSPVEQLHQSIYEGYPRFSSIAQRQSPLLKTAMEQADAIPALLDDFAQMVGGDIRICGKGAEKGRAAELLQGRNGVCIRGLGAVCCAGEPSDCLALLTLVEKNALAYLHALRYGDPPKLSWLDRKLMRYVYTQKYAKKK